MRGPMVAGRSSLQGEIPPLKKFLFNALRAAENVFCSGAARKRVTARFPLLLRSSLRLRTVLFAPLAHCREDWGEWPTTILPEAGEKRFSLGGCEHARRRGEREREGDVRVSSLPISIEGQLANIRALYHTHFRQKMDSNSLAMGLLNILRRMLQPL